MSFLYLAPLLDKTQTEVLFWRIVSVDGTAVTSINELLLSALTDITTINTMGFAMHYGGQ